MKFRNLFTLLLIVGFVVFIGRINFRELSGMPTNQIQDEVNREDVSRRLTTLVKNDKWVEFQIPLHASSIRMMTNAAVRHPETPQPTYTDPRIGYRYSVDFELLDKDRNLIDASVYHFRSRVKQSKDTESGEIIHPLFFGEGDLVSTQTRVMQLAINRAGEKVAIIRIKTRSLDQELCEVVARVTSRVERKDFQKRQTWNRLTPIRREKVCQFCVYNYSLLSELERTNLLRWQWTPAATIGECESRPLYFVGNVDDEQLDWQALPQGKLAMAGSKANFPIPDESGTLRISFDNHNQSKTGNAHLLLPGAEAGKSPRELTHRLADTELVVKTSGGTLQICPETDVAIRTYWKPTDSGQEEFEITPDPILIQSYLSDHRSIEYEISHFGNEPTPFRISARRIFDQQYFNPESSSSPQPINQHDGFLWEMLNESGDVVKRGEVTLNNLQSDFDYVRGGDLAIPVSDQAQYFFAVPPTVKQIRFQSLNRPLLLFGSVRPATLEKVTQVPEDYLLFKESNSTNRAWFALRPYEQPELVRTNRMFFIRTQTPTRDVNEEIANGNYLWTRYIPNGNWIGRRMLVPVDEAQPVREQANPITFVEVPLQTELPIQQVPLGLNQNPKLIFVGQRSPGTVEVFLDGQIAFSRTILSTRGEIQLPKNEMANASSILIKTERPVRAFVNGIETLDGHRFFKRTAQRLDAGELEFHYTKKEAVEFLSLRVFRNQNPDDQLQLKVSIEPQIARLANQQPTSSWTVLNRVFNLLTTEEDSSILIDADEEVDLGRRCFLKLNEDLPPGEYVIRIKCPAPTRGYVLVYQTTPLSAIQPSVVKLESTEDPFILPDVEQDPILIDELDYEPFIVQESDSTEQLESHLKATLKTAKNPAGVESPSAEQLARVQELFLESLRIEEQPADSLFAQWRELGWKLEWLPELKVIVVSEFEDELSGRGVYAFRPNSDSQVALQAPHRFFDERTGTIARKLFSQQDVLAVCWNSAHRKDIDVAHQERHYFNAFMNALTEYNSQTAFIQLHGFAAEDREGPAKLAQVIVSDSTKFPSRHARLAALELKTEFGKQEVKLYPREVRTLGGTENSQASILRSSSQNLFLHLEMSADFRYQLANSASKRAAFLGALSVATANSQD